jgi:hypothetical protein
MAGNTNPSISRWFSIYVAVSGSVPIPWDSASDF